MKKTKINDLPLDVKFKNSIKESNAKIKLHLDICKKELKKAIKISEQYGIPFESPISPLEQIYYPKSFHKKWNIEKLDLLIEDQDDFDFDLENSIGTWEFSDVC